MSRALAHACLQAAWERLERVRSGGAGEYRAAAAALTRARLEVAKLSTHGNKKGSGRAG
jgi:hypothetical protein